MYGNENSKKIFSATHAEPRVFKLPKNNKRDLEGSLKKLEFSKTGKFLFAAGLHVICVYDRDKEIPIYKYKQQKGDRNYLSATQMKFAKEKMIVFATGQFVIGFDLQNEKETFRIESEGQDATTISGKPLVLKNKKVLLD